MWRRDGDRRRRLYAARSKTSLSQLNDGTGVQLRSGNDLSVTLADGSTLDIDLGNAKTLGDVIDAINAASPTKLSAAIGSDGNRTRADRPDDRFGHVCGVERRYRNGGRRFGPTHGRVLATRSPAGGW